MSRLHFATAPHCLPGLLANARKRVCCGAALTLAAVSLSAAELPERIALWPDDGTSASQKGPEKVRVTEGGDHVVSNIHEPGVFPYIPSPESSTGAAVIIAPGGGHRELWTTHEGHNLARWLSDNGVAAFVLYYRLAREADSEYTVDEHALSDTHRAVQLVRSRAAEWHLQPDRVGVMGFSAGGELAALADMRPAKGDINIADLVDQMDSKPNFVGLIYPGSSRRFEVTSDSAPVFIVCGYNDRPDISRGMAELYLKYKQARVPAELHVYAKEGHGFGMRDRQTGAVARWPQRYLEWLADMEMLSGQK